MLLNSSSAFSPSFDLVYLKMENTDDMFSVCVSKSIRIVSLTSHHHNFSIPHLVFCSLSTFKSLFNIVMLDQYVQYGATTPATIITSVLEKRCSNPISHTHRSDILNSLPFFALFLFSSRNPQVADIYGFLLDHWLLHGVLMV